MRRLRRKHGDGGFSLIELLVVLAVLPIIVAALSIAIIAMLNLQGSTTNSLADSSDAQTVSAYYEQDVQSASNITTSATTTQCGPGTQILGLEWNLNPQTSQYASVVSYVEVGTTPNLSLVRQFCAAGYSATPTSRSYVSHDLPTGPLVPTITPSTDAAGASAGWFSAIGLQGISLSVAEPGSKFTYTLFSVPRTSVSASQLTGVGTPTASCNFATPTTGTYASTLCFVDFSSYNYLSTSHTCPGNPALGQWMTAAIVNTPYTLSFCILSSATPSTSTGTLCNTGTGPQYPATVVPCPLPTYFAAPASEAFLGNNGFYTGVPGKPALYENAEGTTASVTISNIQLLNSNGATATGWELVTGDAESTDAGESMTWTSDQLLNLLPNSATSPIGNACAYPMPGQGLTGAGTSVVTCKSSVNSDKTGTVMLEAAAPTKLSVQMVGTGLEAMFMGVLLP
jgi:prepilin-type N-terminal cleavage/methylation domain-containing protein